MDSLLIQCHKSPMKNYFYVYEHRRESDGATFYVGKGRANRAYVISNRNDHWNKVYKKHGMMVHFVAKNLTEKEAIDLEIEIISQYGMVNLCNMTSGGEGLCNPSDETRNKMRLARIGKSGPFKGEKRPPETIAKISASLTGEKHPRWGLKGEANPIFGRKASEETKRKMRIARAKRVISPETCAKISKAKTGLGHHIADHKIYHFRHENGREWIGKRYDFRIMSGFIPTRVHKLVCGQVKKSGGWTLVKVVTEL